MKHKDLSRLTSLELLDLAILAEEEAFERYGEFADQMELHHNVQAAEFFRQLQAREVAHHTQRQEERNQRSGLQTSLEPLHFFDPVESPPYETSHYKMTPSHIFQVTLAAERRAVAFYKKLTEILTDPEAKSNHKTFRHNTCCHLRPCHSERSEESDRRDPSLCSG